MKALIVGLGSIGKRHEANLKILGVKDFVYLHHNNDAHSKHHYVRLEDALAEKPTFAVIANPTSEHIPLSLKIAQAGVHLFIEKPLSNKLDSIDELIKEVRKRKLVAMVGLNFRFHDQIRKIKGLIDDGVIGKVLSARVSVGQYLPDWPYTDYRKSFAAREDLGGGVALTLIHEIDYANWWFGKPKFIVSLFDKVSSLELDVEDVAEILIKYEKGTLVSVHLDYLARSPFRTSHILGEKGDILWDYFKGEISVYSAESGNWDKFINKAFERNDMFIAEMKAFLDAIRIGGPSPINLETGLEGLKTVLAAKQSSLDKRAVYLNDL